MIVAVVLGREWLWGDTAGLWLTLPAVTFFGGALALALGINARHATGHTRDAPGSGRARLGMIFGGIALGGIILAIIALIVILVVLVIAFGGEVPLN